MGLENAVNLLAVTSIDYSVRLEEIAHIPRPIRTRELDLLHPAMSATHNAGLDVGLARVSSFYISINMTR
jgi:hypothetical protein